MQKLDAVAVEALYNKSSYTNFCVDGVGYDSDNFCRVILDFLSVQPRNNVTPERKSKITLQKLSLS